MTDGTCVGSGDGAARGRGVGSGVNATDGRGVGRGDGATNGRGVGRGEGEVLMARPGPTDAVLGGTTARQICDSARRGDGAAGAGK
jgi:hypothetical protein